MLLFGKWRKAVLEMMKFRKYYAHVRKSESISVHRNLIYRALPMLYKQLPEAEEIFGPHRKFMIDLACRPDNSADYEKGVGWHYYSSTNSFGMKRRPSGGYYKNGVHRFYTSARTMFEEDFTMAVSFYRAGYVEKGLEHLTRAIHMLADMSCLPHATGMTYYSYKKAVHQSYEDLARAMYPDAVPEQDITRDRLSIFDDEECFGPALNAIVERQRGEDKKVLKDPVAAITARLQDAEINVCALLYRFCRDIKRPAERLHFVPEGAIVQLSKDKPAYTVRFSQEGCYLQNEDDAFSVNVDGEPCELFRFAHRKKGLFTISPATDKKGRVLVKDEETLADFSPHNKNIFFKV